MALRLLSKARFNMHLKKQGWQYTVHVYKNHVIKKRRSYLGTFWRVVEESVKARKRRKLIESTLRVQRDIDLSLPIMKNSKIPRHILGNPIFLSNGDIKQDRARELGEVLKELVEKKQIAKAKTLINQYFRLNVELWKYGIHEKITNFTKNNGVIGNKVILIDFGEVTDDLKMAQHIIKDKKWARAWSLRHDLPKELVSYYTNRAKLVFTVSNLNKNWKSKI